MTTKCSIECWIVNPDQDVRLLQIPALEGKHEAFWQPITGGIEDSETPLQAALREIREETGLELTDIATDLTVAISPELTIRHHVTSTASGTRPDAVGCHRVTPRPSTSPAGGSPRW
ncbi:NUDIX domain-containing protein [Streptomyces sp. NPDC050095]|uniref:NUDIX domain-containing protein n=1 Tax=unclassified Streptomyces TaxID=2593676 RepID=UPI003444F2DF